MNTPKRYLDAERELNRVLTEYHKTGAKNPVLEKRIYELCLYLTRPIAGTYAKSRPPHVIDDLIHDVVGDLFIYAIPKYTEGMKAWGLYIRRIVLAKLQMSAMQKHTDYMEESEDVDFEGLLKDGMEYPVYYDFQKRIQLFSERVVDGLCNRFPFVNRALWELFVRAVLLTYIDPKSPFLRLARLVDRHKFQWVYWHVRKELVAWFNLPTLEASIGDGAYE